MPSLVAKVKEYALYSVERAVEAAGAAALSMLVADQSNLLHTNWEHIGEVALGAGAASLLSSLRAWSARKKPVDEPAAEPAPVESGAAGTSGAGTVG